MKKFLFCLFILFIANGQAKTLNIGGPFHDDYLPFFHSHNGKKDGFEFDLLEEIARRKGYTINYVAEPFNSLIDNLVAKKVDVIVGEISVTNERKEKINFTIPYYYSIGLNIVVKNNSAIRDYAGLEGKRIGVYHDTESEKIANGINKAKVFTFVKTASLYMELLKGNIDAIINESPVNMYYVAKLNDLKIVGNLINIKDIAFGINKDNDALLNDFNDALISMRHDGKYAEIYKKWFNVNY